jgi:hypothetical protein
VARAGSIKTHNRNGMIVHVGCSCLYFNESRKLVKCEVGDEAFERDLRKKGESSSVRSLYRLIESKCVMRGEMLQQHVSDAEMARGSYIQSRALAQNKHTPLVLDIDEDFFGVTTQRDAKSAMGALGREETELVAQVRSKEK